MKRTHALRSINTFAQNFVKYFFNLLLILVLLSGSGNVAFAQTSTPTKANASGIVNKYQPPVYERPAPRLGDDSSRAVSQTTPPDFDVQLVCINDNCTDMNPGSVLVETLSLTKKWTSTDWGSPAGFNFRIVCDVDAVGCTQKNIYYHTSMQYNWGSPYIRSVQTNLEAKSPALAGTGFLGYESTGIKLHIPCGGGRFGICNDQTWGMIPADHIYQNQLPTSDKGHVRVEGGWENGSLGINDTETKFLVVEVALDPSLLSSWYDPCACPIQPTTSPSPTSTEFDSLVGGGGGGGVAYVADPINTRTGAFTYPFADLSIPTSAGELGFNRLYNSAGNDQNLAALGYGWTHNQDARLIFSSDPGGRPGFALFKSPNGTPYRFWDDGLGHYYPYAGVTSTLTKNSGSPVTYTLRDPSQNTFQFDGNGRLLSRADALGNAWAYTYDSIGRLSRVSADNSTRYLDFSYNANGNISAVRDHAGRSASFSYDASGDLVSSTDVLGQTWQYEYTPNGTDPGGATPAINFNNYALSTYSNQDTTYTAVIENGGSTLHLTGNTWKKISFPYTVTADTVIEFDFKSTVQGKTHGLGLDNDNTKDNASTFSLYGTNSYGVTEYQNYSASAIGWKHYKISVGKYNSGSKLYLFFANGQNVSNPTAQSYFSNVKVYENTVAGHRLTKIVDPAGAAKIRNEYYEQHPSVLNFNSFTLSNYDNQDGAHAAAILDGGNTLKLTGNTWKKISLPYTTTQDTILEFDFKSGVQGEAHGIGVDNDNSGSSANLFKLYGTENIGINRYTDYVSSAPGWKHYKMRVGDYFQGNQLYLFFANDQDISNPTAESYFSNVQIYEQSKWVGRAVRQYDGNGNLTAALDYQSDTATVITDALGNTFITTYNSAGVLTRVTDPLGQETNTTYDGNFLPVTVTNAAGQTLTMEWSADGRNLLAKIDPAGNRTDLTYDALNNLTSVTDPRGYLTTYNYNGKLLTSATDALNRITNYTYNAQGYLISATDPTGRTTSYSYDSHGQRTSMTNSLGNVWNYTYDNLGRLTDTTDPFGHVTLNEYNAAGRLLRTTRNYDPAHGQNYQNLWNIVTEYQYDVRGNQISATDTYGRVTHYEYDAAGRLSRTIDAAGNTSLSAYNAVGKLVSTTDALGHTTIYCYNANGRQIETINALGDSTGVTTFNITANKSTVTDLLGRATVFHYDALGRTVKVVNPLGNFTRTEYDQNGNVVAQIDQLGRTTSYEYDALNRLIRTTDPNGGVTETYYDATGNRSATVDALGNTTTYTYDNAGRLIATTDPLGRATHTEYDSFGRRSASVDAAGQRTTYTYDALNRVVAVTDPAGNTTSTTYNALGNVTARTDANGNSTTMTYDSLNRLITTVDANGNASTNTYDVAGNLISTTDALGHVTSFAYDALGRRISVTDPLGDATHYAYDSLGNLINVTDANGTVTHYEYDSLNRQTAVVYNYRPAFQPNSKTNVRIEYAYNAVGNRVSVTDANGHTTTYAYDNLNRPIQSTDPLGNEWLYEYDAKGNRASITDANGAVTHFAYDEAGQLTDIDYPAPDADSSFTYTVTGQRASMTDGLGTTTWAYDALNRPTSITDPLGQIVQYAYDNAGNRTALTYPDGSEVTYTYDSVNRLTTVTTSQSSVISYQYDDTNRLTNITRPNGVNSVYTYDNAGRLIRLTHSKDGETLADYQYTYDSAGNRTQAIEMILSPEALPTETETPAPTSTDTPTETSTPTDTPTETLTPTDTPLPTETPTLTPTDTPLPTETLTPSETPTETLAPSETPTESPTETMTPIPFVNSPGNILLASYHLPDSRLTDSRFTDSQFTNSQSTDSPRTINYDYDPLRRLASASYSTGEQFNYTYDAAGNVLEYVQTQSGQTETTAYAYDDANQLLTAQKSDSAVVWHYVYDNNGSLSEVLPNGQATNGAKRYTYNTAGYLTQVEAHDGANWQTQAEMAYTGLGQRLTMSASGITTHYALDGSRPLTAESQGNTTFYLYGLGAIAERTTTWAYSLPDGSNTPRQLSDETGAVTLSGSYTPWGDTLEYQGQGNFTFGYFGGLMDAATGLLYVGNGQYYDPSTGRFLTRHAKPDNTNPYVPWNPSSALFAPLALLFLLYGNKRKRSKWDTLVIMLLLGVAVTMSLAACGGATPTPAPDSGSTTPPPQPPATETPTPATNGGTTTANPDAPLATLTATPTPCPTIETPTATVSASTPTSTNTIIPTQTLEPVGDFNLSGYYTTAENQDIWVGSKTPILSDRTKHSERGEYLSINGGYEDDISVAQTAKEDFLTSNSGVCMQGSGILEDGRIILCSQSYPVFEWANAQTFGDLRAFNTVARCDPAISRSRTILNDNDTIYIDAPWLNQFLAEHGNSSGLLKVTDSGQAQGLCNSGGHQGIDIYMGEGQTAYEIWDNFNKTDANEHEVYGEIWWPVYRVIK